MSGGDAALLAAVSCSLLWAAFDVTRKRLVAFVPPVALTCVFAIGQAPLYIGWAAWDELVPPSSGYFWPGFAVWGVNLVANVLFFESLKRAELSATIPLLALTPVFASFLAFFWLQETPQPLEVVGIATVVGGAVMMNFQGHRGTASRRSEVAHNNLIGALMMAAVAALWAATAVFDKMSMQHSAISMHAALQVVALAVSLLIWLAVRGQLRQLAGVRHAMPTFVFGCVTAAAALGLQLYAIMAAHVGVVEAIKRAVGAVAALLLGKLLFGEHIDRQRAFAVLAMAAGVFLVTGAF